MPVATNFPTAPVQVRTLAYHTTQRSTDRPSGRRVAVDPGESPSALREHSVLPCCLLCVGPQLRLLTLTFLSVPNVINHILNTAVDPTNLTHPYWITDHEFAGWTEELLQQTYNNVTLQRNYFAIGSLPPFFYPQIYLHVRRINRHGVTLQARGDKRSDTQK
jgi:hypothetical protein